MNIQTQRFVTKSSLFEGLETLEDVFDESDHLSITWGGANRTMIDPQYFLQEWEAIERDVIVMASVNKKSQAYRHTNKDKFKKLAGDGLTAVYGGYKPGVINGPAPSTKKGRGRTKCDWN